MKPTFARASNIRREIAQIVRAPRRMLPSEAATKYLRNDQGAWDPNLAPMMVEPLDLLSSREYQGIVFIGPARAGKTFGLILAGFAYVVTCSPGDMLMIQMSHDSARDFSRGDLDKAIRYSPDLAAAMSPLARDDNTFDKFFRSGIRLKLGWPAVSQLSSKTLKYVFFTDYDRPENRDDVDGEGPMWDLGFKRIDTYMSRGKCLAESSPGEQFSDAKWKPNSPHEAPPVRGICSLYNRGTRARYYWLCKHCGEPFEAAPGIKNFALPDFEELQKIIEASDDLVSLAESYSYVPCPECGGIHDQADRAALNATRLWVHEGEHIENGRVVGTRRRSQIASFWMGGVAAPYLRWDTLLLRYFQGILTYARTGDEQPLKATTNTDQGAPYLSRRAAARRSSEALMQRAEDWPRGAVPAGVRFLTAAIDVQAHKFVVTIVGWGVRLESWIIDHFSISSSKRAEGSRFAALDPAAFVEDWNVLIDEVLNRTYPVVNLNVRLGIHFALCDSGGKEGVTTNAYKFWRGLRDKGMGKRLMLLKGDSRMNMPRTSLTWPDSRNRKDRAAGGMGDVPVWLLNVNSLKDAVSGDLAREEPGPGYIHIPRWIDSTYYDELTAETRTDKGWTNEHKARNEGFDLAIYSRAATIILKAEGIDWDKPPIWAIDPAQRAESPVANLSRPLGRSVRSGGVDL